MKFFTNKNWIRKIGVIIIIKVTELQTKKHLLIMNQLKQFNFQANKHALWLKSFNF